MLILWATFFAKKEVHKILLQILSIKTFKCFVWRSACAKTQKRENFAMRHLFHCILCLSIQAWDSKVLFSQMHIIGKSRKHKKGSTCKPIDETCWAFISKKICGHQSQWQIHSRTSPCYARAFRQALGKAWAYPPHQWRSNWQQNWKLASSDKLRTSKAGT